MSESIPSEISNHIRDWRKHRGMTQSELGDSVGYSKVHISRWESGMRRINLDQLQALADVLQCTLYDLIYCNPEDDIDLFNMWAELTDEKRDMFRAMIKGLINQE